MNARRFYKMTGSGNDFVFLDGREHRLDQWPAARIQAVCDRRRGVGADGIVLLSRLDSGAIRMIYYNADGSHADMCGNAALCSTRLAVTLDLADPGRIELATDAGMLDSRCVGPASAAELRFPTVAVPTPVSMALVPGERRAFQGTVGVPHLVVLVDEIDRVDVERRGRVLRFAPEYGAAGNNVNFIGPIAGEASAWGLRTYERGVEGETLACGTGTVAAALAFAAVGISGLPINVRSGSGSVYSVAGSLAGSEARDVWLCGEGRLVFDGTLR